MDNPVFIDSIGVPLFKKREGSGDPNKDAYYTEGSVTRTIPCEFRLSGRVIEFVNGSKIFVSDDEWDIV
jgi:hypothetical protein